ncbi:hypothetical protein F5X68DRAFT_253656 [Plectosphaerella plurivora]|uniref:DUF6536 domain-containing protein n=1 Tax=Plectosphaerella plurivora TaxID=936078 RepID=A0A9P8VHE4_9PEZI|nr:hypothetical protein F5X68DRAFT_253656 [Plectosphaerella plurivora]
MGHGKDVIEYTTPVSADDGKDGAGERDRLMGSNQAEGVSSSFKSPPYADADYLMQYIPSLARHRPEKSTWERIREWIGLPAKPKRDGQDDADLMSKRIEMIRNQAIMAVCVVTLNVAITAWAIVYYPPEGQGVGTFYTGACPTASAINSAAHVVLNALSTIFLGAGNYCMQILVAPSREEMDKAHKLGKTLEIGVPSLKNLFRISRRRVFGWVTLGIFAMTLHVFWNSAIFTSLPTVFIHRAVVTSDFMDATDSWALDDAVARIDEDRERNWPEKTPKRKPLPVNATVIYDMQAPAQTNSYTRIGTRECIEAFISPSNATRALVLVAQNMTSAQNGDSSLIDAAVFGWDADNSWASAWICEAYQKKEPWDFCLLKWAETEFIDDWTLAEPRVKIDSCLVGEEGDNSERCGLHYSTHVMGIVCGCTFIEFLLILAIWFQQRHTAKGALHDDDQNMSWEERKRKREARRTMTTVGDAIQSYLDNPGHVAFEERTEPGMWGIKYVKWKPQKDISWFKAVSVGAWIRAMTL